MRINGIPLFGVLLLGSSHWLHAAPNDPSRLLPAKEPIPDDIWETIASPFDPISNPPGFTAPQRIEQMLPPQPQLAAPAARPAAPPAPQGAPQVPPRPAPAVQDFGTPAPPSRAHYVAQPAPLPAAPAAVPYQLPPQEKPGVATEYPEEYWNCLLNNLQGVGSDVAAKLITRACQKKHPKE
jgi:hypothetical protein